MEDEQSMFGKLRQQYSDSWKLLIKPMRMEYGLESLGGRVMVLNKTSYKRHDFEVLNRDGHPLKCSYFEPQTPNKSNKPEKPGNQRLSDRSRYPNSLSNPRTLNEEDYGFSHLERKPVLVYLHSQTGSRVEGMHLLEYCSNLSVGLLIYDSAGTGLSGGDYVTLGWFESQDLGLVLNYFRNKFPVGPISLWGRSMGAVTAIMYCEKRGEEVGSLVLDSPFADLREMVIEIGNREFSIPRFMMKIIIRLYSGKIEERIGVDIFELKPGQAAAKCMIPAYFIVGKNDNLLPKTCVMDLYKKYKAKKKMISHSNANHSEGREDFIIEGAFEFVHDELSKAIYHNQQKNQFSKGGGRESSRRMKEKVFFDPFAVQEEDSENFEVQGGNSSKQKREAANKNIVLNNSGPSSNLNHSDLKDISELSGIGPAFMHDSSSDNHYDKQAGGHPLSQQRTKTSSNNSTLLNIANNGSGGDQQQIRNQRIQQKNQALNRSLNIGQKMPDHLQFGTQVAPQFPAQNNRMAPARYNSATFGEKAPSLLDRNTLNNPESMRRQGGGLKGPYFEGLVKPKEIDPFMIDNNSKSRNLKSQNWTRPSQGMEQMTAPRKQGGYPPLQQNLRNSPSFANFQPLAKFRRNDKQVTQKQSPGQISLENQSYIEPQQYQVPYQQKQQQQQQQVRNSGNVNFKQHQNQQQQQQYQQPILQYDGYNHQNQFQNPQILRTSDNIPTPEFTGQPISNNNINNFNQNLNLQGHSQAQVQDNQFKQRSRNIPNQRQQQNNSYQKARQEYYGGNERVKTPERKNIPFQPFSNSISKNVQKSPLSFQNQASKSYNQSFRTGLQKQTPLQGSRGLQPAYALSPAPSRAKNNQFQSFGGHLLGQNNNLQNPRPKSRLNSSRNLREPTSSLRYSSRNNPFGTNEQPNLTQTLQQQSQRQKHQNQQSELNNPKMVHDSYQNFGSAFKSNTSNRNANVKDSGVKVQKKMRERQPSMSKNDSQQILQNFRFKDATQNKQNSDPQNIPMTLDSNQIVASPQKARFQPKFGNQQEINLRLSNRLKGISPPALSGYGQQQDTGLMESHRDNYDPFVNQEKDEIQTEEIQGKMSSLVFQFLERKLWKTCNFQREYAQQCSISAL